jgi:HSP20 family protein
MTYRDPTEDFNTWNRAMSRLVEDSFVPTWLAERRAGGRVLRLPLDAYITAEEIVILASIPGADPEDVEITFEGDTLTIQGEIQAPLENVDYALQERPFGQFRRNLTINTPVNINKAEAKFDNGVLTLILPKAEESRAKSIEIKSKKK